MKELKMLKDTLRTAEELRQQYEDTGVLLEMRKRSRMKAWAGEIRDKCPQARKAPGGGADQYASQRRVR